MKLTTADCESAKPRRKPYKLGDGGGLYLYVAPNGGKLWRYDFIAEGRRKTFSIGPLSEVNLDKAREARDAAKQEVRDGLDPTAEKKAREVARKLRNRQTFGDVADELLEKLRREGKASATIKKRQWLLKDLAKDIKDRPIARLTAAEILTVLQQVESRGHLETARRLRAAIGQVMRLAVATNRAPFDPTPALRGAIATPRVTHRAAIVDRKGIGNLMQAIRGYDRPVIRHALMLSAYCFPRPGELRLAQWEEVDLKAKVWTIPAERTKMRREHRIPLSPQAVKHFTALKRITGRNETGLCFPGQRRGRPISENTINAALRTLGYDGDTHVGHGWRATASTILNERSDFSPDAIERALGHMEQNAVRRAYHRAEYWDERIAIMDWYADFLDRARQDERFFGE